MDSQKKPAGKPALRASAAMVCIALLVGTHLLNPPEVRAQWLGQDNWQEAPVSLPPSFRTEQLQTFDVSTGSRLVYGLDPDTLRIEADGVVRYVMVARSPSGTLNVFYEGIRCKTGEFRTYARWDPRLRAWQATPAGDTGGWKSIASPGISLHVARLARDGFCDGTTPNGTPDDILRALKRGSPILHH